jgi:hypothetical protein
MFSDSLTRPTHGNQFVNNDLIVMVGGGLNRGPRRKSRHRDLVKVTLESCFTLFSIPLPDSGSNHTTTQKVPSMMGLLALAASVSA